MKKKWLFPVCIASILNSFFCANLFASYSGGSGTEVDPYQIANKADLLAMAAEPSDYDKHFVMNADIDLTGTNFISAVIAADTDSASYGFQGTEFTGVFDGGGHVVSNMYIDAQDSDYVGLFGRSSGVITNLGVVSCIVTNGADYIGGLCGCNRGGVISRCYSMGSVGGDEDTGGLCGFNQEGTISDCYTTGSVSGNDDVGGFCGENYFGWISSCYSTAFISGDRYVGGFCGHNCWEVSCCYSTGTVSGNDAVGGFCGWTDLCYGGQTINCFWDIETSGWTTSDGGTGTNTVDMQTLSTFTDAGWDFVGETVNGMDDTWIMGGYPLLSWQGDVVLSVINGYGGGIYINGAVVNVECFDIGEEYSFSHWDIDPPAFSNSLSDVFSSSATFIMPETNVTLTAVYIKYGGGSGTADDPYRIGSVDDFLHMIDSTNDYDKCFVLTADIDLSGIRFAGPVIAADIFDGIFDGNGYAIRDVMIISDNESVEIGLFGWLGENAVVRDLKLEDIFIIADGLMDYSYIGSLCAENNGGIIERCCAMGLILGSFSEEAIYPRCYVGGLCGLNSGMINECFSDVDVYFEGGDSRSCVGGICGKTTGPDWGEEQSYIFNSCSWGALSVDGFSGWAGGIAGHCGGVILRCYSTSPVIGAVNEYYAGGLVGECGGNGVVRNSFWDMESSGLILSDGGTGLYTSEMQTQATFTDAGWDFAYETENGLYDTWYMDGYPKLSCFDPVVPVELQVSGPEYVDEGGTGQFVCHAVYYGDVAEDVSSQVQWMVDTEPGVAISPSGVLSVDGITHHLFLTVRAVYTVNGVIRSSQKSVVARNMPDVGDAGTAENPVLIMTKSELLDLAATPENYGLHFLLGADIDLSGEAFSNAVIASEQVIPFSGVFDGNGHSILNMQIVAGTQDSSYLGFFGRVDGEGSCVMNLHVENAVINGGESSACVGAVCGHNGGIVSNCFVSAEISAGMDSAFIGGVCGYSMGDVIASFAEGSVSGDDSVGGICGCCDWGSVGLCGSRMSVSASAFAGGACGYNQGGLIYRCFNEAGVESLEFVGGLCGANVYGDIRNSYSAGDVIGASDSSFAGGVCGYNLQGGLQYCYSVGIVNGLDCSGGVCGGNAGEILSCFWDIQSSGIVVSDGGTGLTTVQMQEELTFTSAGWDFTGESVNGSKDLWSMSGYPVLVGVSFPAAAASGFAEWLNLEGVPSSLGAETEMPAADGIPNLLKYACGLSPLQAYSSADLFTMSLDESVFSIVYNKSKQASDVTLEALWASSPAGPWISAGITYELLSDDGIDELWRASIPLGSQGFMRLRATLTEE